MSIIDNKIEVRVSFDTTGSMYPALGQVRREGRKLFERLAAEIPGIRMGVTAHGDYCDAGSTYVTKHLPLTSDLNSVVSFIDKVGATGGGDSDECYELVLQESQQTAMGWTPGYQHILVMIGDANPHSVGYRHNGTTYHVDWRQEAMKLRDMGVKIYAVQALGYYGSKTFWQMLAEIGGGYHIPLDQFAYITDMLLAICYKQQGSEQLQKFEDELSKGGRLTRNMATAMGTLSGRSVAETTARTTKLYGDVGALKTCDPSRFQVLNVDTDSRIDLFVEGNHIPFTKGRGFYAFMKPEDIQPNKEVVLMDLKSGDLFEGPVARDLLGLPKDRTLRLNPKEIPSIMRKYKVFIQSNSYNRKLIGGHEFLYEVVRDR